jgi:hypothetical protein
LNGRKGGKNKQHRKSEGKKERDVERERGEE